MRNDVGQHDNSLAESARKMLTSAEVHVAKTMVKQQMCESCHANAPQAAI